MGARDPHALLLAAGQLARESILDMTEPDTIQRAARSRRDLGTPTAAHF
jgi:hypothetical protein